MSVVLICCRCLHARWTVRGANRNALHVYLFGIEFNRWIFDAQVCEGGYRCP